MHKGNCLELQLPIKSKVVPSFCLADSEDPNYSEGSEGTKHY